MATSALEKIQAIQQEAEQKIAALKQEAVTEIVKKIAEAKAALAALEEEYSALTGRTLKGDKADGSKRTRRTFTDEQKAEFESLLLAAINANPNQKGGVYKAAVSGLEESGLWNSSIASLKEKGLVEQKGEKAGATYAPTKGKK